MSGGKRDRRPCQNPVRGRSRAIEPCSGVTYREFEVERRRVATATLTSAVQRRNIMFPTRLLSFASLLAFSSAGFAQSANTVFGAGYSFPAPVNAAPGQILNLFVQGIGANLTQKVGATSLPLPAVLAGISVQLRQGPQSTAVPLFAVRPISTCLTGAVVSGSTCGQYTAVTVQIPYELVPNCQWGNCGSAKTLAFFAPVWTVVEEMLRHPPADGNHLELGLEFIHGFLLPKRNRLLVELQCHGR